MFAVVRSAAGHTVWLLSSDVLYATTSTVGLYTHTRAHTLFFIMHARRTTLLFPSSVAQGRTAPSSYSRAEQMCARIIETTVLFALYVHLFNNHLLLWPPHVSAADNSSLSYLRCRWLGQSLAHASRFSHSAPPPPSSTHLCSPDTVSFIHSITTIHIHSNDDDAPFGVSVSTGFRESDYFGTSSHTSPRRLQQGCRIRIECLFL